MDDKDQVKFISSLDFDISKVDTTMEKLNSIFEKNMSSLEKRVRDSTDNISKMLTGIGGIKIDSSSGIGSPQQIAKDINKNLANVMTNAVKHLNTFLDKVGQEVYEMEVKHEIEKECNDVDKEIAKYVRQRINLASSDIREELQRVPVWARSDRGSKLDDIADETLSQFPSLAGYGGGTPSEMLLNFFDSYKAYNKTKKELLEDINEVTQGLAKVKDYAGKSITQVTDEITKTLETVLDPKELEKFKGLSFEGKRDYLVDVLNRYKQSIDGLTDEGTKRLIEHIEAITGQSELTSTKADQVKQAVNNLKTAQKDLQERVVKIIDDDIKSIKETFGQDQLRKLSITKFFDEDGNISSTAETHTESQAKLQGAAYKDLLNLTKQLFDVEGKRVGASEKQLEVLNAIEGVISEQMTDVFKIIEAYGLENTELEKNLQNETRKLGNAVMLKRTKAEEAEEARKQMTHEKTQAALAKSQADERQRMVKEELRTSKEKNKMLDEEWALRKRMADSLPKMEADAATAQQKIRTKELSAELVAQAATLREQIQAMREKLTQSGLLTKEEASQTAEMQKQLDLLQQQIKTESGDLQQGKTIREAPFMARMQTALSYGLIYKGIHAMKQAVSTISDVEMGIVEIARVSDDASFNFDKVRDSIIQLGVEYGQTFENVQHITLRWVQSGYDIADALELTRTSLLALNTAELDSRQATESLIGIMAQWNLQTSDLSLVLDKINKVADSFSLTSQDLVDGLLRASGAARIMGLDIDHTIALLTTMREASGRTGREVGNALNSILSYIQRAGSTKIMESMGIRMFADEARTQFRNVFEVFSELSEKWNDPNIAQGAKDALMAGAEEAGLFAEELAGAVGMQDEYVKMTEAASEATGEYTDVQKRDAAQAAAGIFRRNYFIGLLERFTTTQKALTVASEAEGYSMRENERTMEALEKKIQALKTAYVQLAIAIGEAGFLDSLKDITDSTKDMVNYIAQLDSPMKNLIINLGIILGTIKAIKVTSSLLGVDGIFTALGGLLSAPMTAGISTALIGIGAIAMTVRTEMKKAADEKERLLEGSADEVAGIERLDLLISKYESLSKAADENSESKIELLKLQRQLAEEFPEYVDGIDEENNLIITNIEAVKQLNELKREELELKREELALKLKEEDIPRLEQRQIEIKERIAAIDKQIAEGDTKRTIHYGKGVKEEIDLTELLRKEKQKLLLEQQKNNIEIQKYSIYLEEYAQSYIEVYARMLRKQEELRDKNKLDYIKMNQDSQEFYSKVLTGYRNLYGDIKDLYDFDLSNYSSLAQAKADIEMKLLSGLATQWSDYYNAQEGTLKMDISELQRLTQLKGDTPETIAAQKQAEVAYNKIMTAARLLNRLKSASIEVAPGSGVGGGYGTGDTDAEDGKGSATNEALRDYLRMLQHKKAMDELSIADEILGYEYALKHFAKTTEEKMDLTEKIYATKKRLIEEEKKAEEELNKIVADLMNNQLESLKKAYNERIKLIDEEANKKKKAQQDIIDGIDEEIEALNKKEKAYSHKQKIADLEEKLAYHQMRTGIKHEEAARDIENQIAEEKRSYKNEKLKEELNDKKQAAQEEIKNIEKTANDQKTIIKSTLDSFDELFNGSNKSIISAAMAMSKEYSGIVDNMIKSAKKAILESDLSEEIDIGGYEKIESVVAKGKESQELEAYAKAVIDYKRQYDNAMRTGNQAGTVSAFENAKTYYKNLEETAKGKTIANLLRKMSYEQAKDWLKTATFHSGGKNIQEGLALLKRNEIVLNPKLSEAFEKFTISLSRNPMQSISNMQSDSSTHYNRKSTTIDKAVNIENAYFEDETDIEIFGREVKRVVGALP